MDDDYRAASGGQVCGHGKIRRKGYTTRRGVRVRSACIKDRGAIGRWKTVQRSQGIGPLASGDLKRVGYSATMPVKTRHASLKKAVSRHGRASTIRKLNAIAVYTKRTVPSRSAIYRTDMHYVQKKY